MSENLKNDERGELSAEELEKVSGGSRKMSQNEAWDYFKVCPKCGSTNLTKLVAANAIECRDCREELWNAGWTEY